MHTPDKAVAAQRQRPKPAEEPLLLSVPEAARLLGVGATFGWTMVRRGEIPTIKLGRRVLVPRAAIEQLADAAQGKQGLQEDGRPSPDVRLQSTSQRAARPSG